VDSDVEFQFKVDAEEKFVPLMVSVKAGLPTVAEVGLMLVIVGALEVAGSGVSNEVAL
jgi:hypothetical protein